MVCVNAVEPEMAMGLLKTAFVPLVLLSVTVHALLAVPMVWLPKSMLVGEKVTTWVAAVPVPVRLTVSGVLTPLTSATRLPVTAPAADGVKVICTLQVEYAGSVVPQ